jgi:hypothetical protein
MDNGIRKHWKPRAQHKEQSIRVRVTAQQKRALADPAQREGLEVSAWLRALGLRDLDRESSAA